MNRYFFICFFSLLFPLYLLDTRCAAKRVTCLYLHAFRIVTKVGGWTGREAGQSHKGQTRTSELSPERSEKVVAAADSQEGKQIPLMWTVIYVRNPLGRTAVALLYPFSAFIISELPTHIWPPGERPEPHSRRRNVGNRVNIFENVSTFSRENFSLVAASYLGRPRCQAYDALP